MNSTNNPSSGQFSEPVEKVKARLEELSQLAAAHVPEQAGLYERLFADVRVLLEELEIADKELHQQNFELALTREQVEAEKQRYQELFEFAPDGYLVTDRDGLILEANRAARELLNAPLANVLRKPLAKFILLEDRRDFRHKLSRLRDQPTHEGQVEHWELRLKPRKREPFYASITVAVVKDVLPGAEAASLRWLVRDVDQRRRLQRELNELRHKLVAGRERERQQLARELHDGPVQDLFAVTYQLVFLEKDLQGRSALEHLKAVRARLESVIVNLRDIFSDLRPPALAPFGLREAISSHATTIQERHPEINCHLHLAPEGVELEETASIALFRIYQEALANVLRHARAKNVWVSLFDNGDELVLDVEDDGVGFQVPDSWIDLVRRGQYGLADAAERAEAICSALELDSVPGNGAHLRVALKTGAASEIG